jgi:putative PEP-CTERM system TPR-repeat lipoprotein
MDASSAGRCFAARIFLFILLAGAPAESAAANVRDGSSVQSLAPDVKLLVTRAQDAIKRNDLRVATLLLKNAAQAAPNNGAVEAELGKVLVMQGQMVQAERILRQARSHGAPDPAVLPGLFQAMLSQHESQAVLDQFPEPSGRSPTAMDTLRARALAYFSLNQPDAADAEIDKALAIRRAPSLLVNKAEFAVAKGDRVTADSLTNEALKAAANDRTALIMKIGLLERQDAYPSALGYANRLVQSFPGDPLPLVLRIEVLAKLQRDKEAEADVDSLLKIAPNLPIALYDRALLLARKGNVKGAWQIAQGLSPEFIHSAPQFGLGFAQIAKASGNAELSDAALSAVVSTYPANAEARRTLAERRLAQKNYAAALELLQPIADSPDPHTLMLVGNTYRGLGQARKADDYLARARAAQAGNTGAAAAAGQPIEDIRNIVAKDPANADATGALILRLIGQGRSEEAQAAVDRFEKAAPRNAISAYFRGQIAMTNGDLDNATNNFTAALRAMPAFVPALYYRAQVAAARGDWTAANADLDAILLADPHNIQALSKKAQYAAAAGQDDAAAKLYARAVTASPNAAEPQFAMAGFYLTRAKYGEAQKAATVILDRHPNDVRAASILVRSYLAQHATDRAKALAQKLSAANPKSTRAQLLLAYVLEQAQDQKGALAAYQAAVQAEPASNAGYSALASYYLRTGQKDKAVETARNLSKRTPGPESDLFLADTLLKAGYAGPARSVLEKSAVDRPSSQGILTLVAIQMRTDRKGAEKRLAGWVATHGKDVSARNQLANMLLADGDMAAAKSQLEQALRYQPYNASVLNDLAWTVQKSDPARAIKLATQAAKISPKSGEILDTLAWLKWQQNNRSESLGLLKKAHTLSPAEPNIAYHLAVALDGSGDRAAARDVLQVAVKSNLGLSNREEVQRLQAKWK